MKSIKKISALIIILAGTLLKTSIVFSQCVYNVGGLTVPNRVEVQAPTGYFVSVTSGSAACSPSVAGLATMPGMGINIVGPNSPQYMLDILCDPSVPTNQDVNISCPNCTNSYTSGTDAVGYRIGGNMFLWHDGTTSDAYVGVGSAGGASATVPGTNNTFLGGDAGYNMPLCTSFSNPDDLTFVGYSAGYNFGAGSHGGTDNVYVGSYAGYSDQASSYNTFIGSYAGYSTNGGYYNTMTGIGCGKYNITGYGNNYYGKYAGADNNGNFNCFYGGHSGQGYTTAPTDSNSFFGVYSGEYIQNAENNVFMGMYAGNGVGSSIVGASPSNDNVYIGANTQYLSGKNLTGNYNITLGYQSMAYTGSSSSPGVITNAAAIGADAIVLNNNSFILGNNGQNVGIGLSNNPVGPGWNLEICTENNAAASFPPYLGGGTSTTSNVYGGEGFSGLRLRDLTSASTVVNQSSSYFGSSNPYPSGVLSVDGYGNVIYVPVSSGGTGIGYCTALTPMTADGGYDLSTNNFYFKGNNSTLLNQNDVLIGYSCGTSPIPAKLSVLQNSSATPTSQSSIGIYVENDDLQYGATLTNAPVIGIKSYVPASGFNCESIAGWFEAPGGCVANNNYGIIVPPGGGASGFGITNPSGTLDVYGELYNQGNTLITTLGGGTTALTATSNISTSGTNTGVQGVADNSTYLDIGVAGFATGVSASGLFHEGIYGAAYTSPGTANDCAGVFVGNVYTTGGSNSLGGFINGSDSILKRKINSFSNAISIIKKLSPKTYYFDTINSYHASLDTFQHYGFIAQQVQRVVPCIVRTIVTPPLIDTAGNITVPASTVKGLDYNQFAAILTAGFQEQMQIANDDSVKQKQTNDSLRYTLDSLRNAFKSIQNCLNTLCSNGGGHGANHHNSGGGNSGDTNTAMSNEQDVTLSAMPNTALLYQNIPNPFTSGTKINYFLPANIQGASIVFYDTYGNQLKVVQLSQTGNGTLNITPDNLASGIYSYSLIVNNNVIDTKRMILQK